MEILLIITIFRNVLVCPKSKKNTHNVGNTTMETIFNQVFNKKDMNIEKNYQQGDKITQLHQRVCSL